MTGNFGLNLPSLSEENDKAASESTNAGANLFNPGALAKTVTQNQRNVVQSAGDLSALGAVIGKDAASLTERAVAAKQEFQTSLDGLLKQIEDTNATVMDASQKARNARYVPEAAALVMSLFGNNDYDPDYQKSRVEESMRSLDIANRRVNAIGTVATVKEQMAEQAVKGTKMQLEGQQVQAQVTESGTRTLIALQQEQERQISASLDKMTDAQIAKALNDPSFAAKAAPGATPGMIENTMKRREQFNLALNTAKLSFKHMQTTYPELEKQTKNNTKLSDLNVMLNQAKVPAEIQEVLTKSITTVIDNMPTQERQQLLVEANNNGGIAQLNLGDGTVVNVSDSQIQAAISKRNKQIITDAKDTSALADAQIDVNAYLSGAGVMIERLTTAYTGIAQPEELLDINSKTKAIIGAVQEGQPAGMFAAQKAVKDINDKVKALEDKVKKDFPLQAPATKSYLYKGEVDDVSAASAFLSDRFKVGANTIAPGNIFFEGGEILSKYSAYVAAQSKAFPGGMGKDGKTTIDLADLTKNPPKELIMFEEFLSKSSGMKDGEGKDTTNGQWITAKVRGQIRMNALNAAVLDLAAVKPDGGSIPEFSKAILNGQLLPRYQANPKNLFADLAAADIINGTSSLASLYAQMNSATYQKQIVNWYQSNINSPDAASMSKRFVNNNPLEMIAGIKRDISIAMEQAKKTTAAAIADFSGATGIKAPPGGVMYNEEYGSKQSLINPINNNPLINQDLLIQKMLGAP